MIQDHDRSGWFGASDTAMIVGNWNTKTFEKWWLQKLGINRDSFETVYTVAGTHWEHRILESLRVPHMTLDRQILVPSLSLRVNLDGDTGYRIYECKTHKAEKPRKSTPKHYVQQVQVQMFASGIREAEIVAYAMQEADYQNFLREIDPRRLREIPVPYDPRFIDSVYLPRLRILSECLKRGAFPRG